MSATLQLSPVPVDYHEPWENKPWRALQSDYAKRMADIEAFEAGRPSFKPATL